MGVPKFYRFISERYPLINTSLRQSSTPQIDNLYVDMNGIIHNCVRGVPGNDTSGSSRYSSSVPSATKSHEQIFLDVFKYIDNLFALITPRRVLYMAIDGVAPRAKMNQQRARRFRSAKDRLDEHKQKVAEDPMYAAAEVEPFDSNCITPGTKFMYKLTQALKYFVTKKLTEDINWTDIDVILSGAEAPGEGEHKIMAYIRSLRESGQLPPNTRHCVYGLDADLIMLGLVTHEPHFFILREKVDFNYWKKKGGPRVATALDTTIFGEFELLSIGLLREYLVLELGADGNCELPYFDVERVADDFVFILMLIGNDFLPGLPTLDIAGGTLHVMLHLYKRVLPLLGGYLTDTGKIHGDRLEYFFAKLGLLEEDVLRQKLEQETSKYGRRNRQGTRGKTFANVDLDKLFGMGTSSDRPKILSSEDLRIASLLNREKTKSIETLKNAYYEAKFGFEFSENSSLEHVTKTYLEGIAWTLKYYTEGCRQWRWFYPEHYAPLASDVTGVVEKLKGYEENIVPDKPFRPFEQLMSVLPPVSSWCLPSPYQKLMKSPSSPIRDQYPEDFKTDLNGKRNDWESVVLLPFIDEMRLREAIRSIPSEALSPEETIRNEFGPSYVYHRDVNSIEIARSPFEMGLPSFVNQTKRENLVLPSISPAKPFTPALLPGTKAAKSGKEFEDLPTLKVFEHKSRLQAIGLNVFGTPSKSDSLVLIIEFELDKADEGTNKSTSSGSQFSILDQKGVTVGSAVWCGYPWRVAGWVESIVNEFVTKRELRPRQLTNEKMAKQRKNRCIETKSTKKDNFIRDVNVVTSSLIQKYAISVSNPKQIVTVRKVEDTICCSMSKTKEISLYHDHFLTLRDYNEEKQTVAKKHTRQFGNGVSVLYVGHGCYFGHKGSVVSRSVNGMVRVQFERSSPAAKEPAFGYRVVSTCRAHERWMPLSKLAATVAMKVSLVDQLLGSLRVRLSSGKEEVDLGLGVRYSGRGLYIPGYVRPDDRSRFLFSQKCADLLRNYATTFPTLFENVDKVKAGESGSGGRVRGIMILEVRQLFPDVKKPDEAAKAVSTWISVQDVASLPLVSTKANVLAREVVLELEKQCSIARALQREFDEVSRTVTRGGAGKDVNQSTLLTGREALGWNVDTWTTPKTIHHAPLKADASDLRLGDRVVNRMGSGGVPFGLRGTVIGIYPRDLPEELDEDENDDPNSVQALVEVCFDEGFIGGGTLGNRCSKGRGKAVPASSLIVVRPDRDNTFYARNYVRVATRVELALKHSSDVCKYSVEKSVAVADAAAQSYALAVKKKSVPMTRMPAFADKIGEPTNLLMAQVANETGCDITSDQVGIIMDDLLEARPENLPLPSFLCAQPSGIGSSKGQLDAAVNEQAVHEVEKDGNRRDTNGDARFDASVVEELVKGALERAEYVKCDGDVGVSLPSPFALQYHSRDDSRTDGATDEDEFAAVWRRLQISSESDSSRDQEGT